MSTPEILLDSLLASFFSVICSSLVHAYKVTDMGPFQEFTLFPLLPTELRLKIWKMSILPRIVLRHQYDTQTNHRPAVLFTPCIPALLQVSQEARQIGLENYQVVKARHCNMLGNTTKRLGPIYFHPELDTLLCAVWDGQNLSPVCPDAFPQRILKQARDLAITELDFQEIIHGCAFTTALFNSDMDRTNRMNTTYNKLRRCYEKLETVSILYNFQETPRQGPWKLKFECFRDMMAGAPAGSTDLHHVARWMPHLTYLTDIELAYPDWKAPTVNQAVFQCTEAFAKK
jgi:hypothetical protein